MNFDKLEGLTEREINELYINEIYDENAKISGDCLCYYKRGQGWGYFCCISFSVYSDSQCYSLCRNFNRPREGYNGSGYYCGSVTRCESVVGIE